ncbi:MAG TPA: hypothetical protein VF278_02725 [Pirellulales bacterium]
MIGELGMERKSPRGGDAICPDYSLGWLLAVVLECGDSSPLSFAASAAFLPPRAYR